MKYLPRPPFSFAAYAPAEVTDMRRQFHQEGYALLPRLLSGAIRSELNGEVEDLAPFQMARHFLMPGYETPRIMHTISGKAIRAHAHLITFMYRSRALRSLLAAITAQSVHSCSHPKEWAVINLLTERGATHGWHFDDPPLALVIILEAPRREAGGLVEFVRLGVPRQKRAVAKQGVAAFVTTARGQGQVRTAHHGAGDAYLLRADRCLHRVTGLQADCHRRSAINLAFEFARRPNYGASANLLYD